MNILLIGDEIIDRYIHCKAERLCPEAPVPVLIPIVEKQRIKAGGAALVRDNMEALGLKPTCLFGSVSMKTRYFVDGHMTMRVDEDSNVLRPILPEVETAIESASIIVISDYAKGGVSEQVYEACLQSNKTCFIDTKISNVDRIASPKVTVFPNASEHRNFAGREHQFRAVVSKQGENGCILWDDSHENYSIPTRARDVRDVCGAGDVFMASYIWARTLGLTNEDSAIIANEAAGISVTHVGTYILSPADVAHLHKLANEITVETS